jgi:hypothetical protein
MIKKPNAINVLSPLIYSVRGVASACAVSTTIIWDIDFIATIAC